jgi:hypothetical protein
MAAVGATTRSGRRSPAHTSERYRAHSGDGAGFPLTACHHVATHEWATTSAGAANGHWAWAYPFRWTTSGRRSCSSVSSQSPARRTSSHGWCIHSSLNVLGRTSTFGNSATCFACAGDSASPIVARTNSTPSGPIARASSTAYVHTPPTVSVVISTRTVGPP